VPYEILDAAGCIEAEGGLRYASAKFAGGLRLLGDETGDCFKFTQQLAEAAAAGGVQFHYDTHIENIHVWRDNIVALETNRDKITGDAFVAALGSYSPILLKQIGIKLPILPVKGYSLTIPITEQIGAPQSTVMDETHKVAITRLGGNIRVAGMAELAGYDLALRDRRRETLERVVSDLFPRGGNPKDSSFWCGLRSMTPDSVPILGATPLRNLHLNTGHGTLGWTMSCGSARVVADLISGRTPDIDMDGLTIDRFGARARA
jgi:D-amino-acid dehydrogenase